MPGNEAVEFDGAFVQLPDSCHGMTGVEFDGGFVHCQDLPEEGGCYIIEIAGARAIGSAWA